MSGRDERKVKSIACDCGRFEYWIMKTRLGFIVGFLNDKNHLEGGAIGRVNLPEPIMSLVGCISLIDVFVCRGCGRRIAREALNAEPLLVYLEEHWDKRTD